MANLIENYKSTTRTRVNTMLGKAANSENGNYVAYSTDIDWGDISSSIISEFAAPTGITSLGIIQVLEKLYDAVFNGNTSMLISNIIVANEEDEVDPNDSITQYSGSIIGGEDSQITLVAHVFPKGVNPNSIVWISSDPSVSITEIIQENPEEYEDRIKLFVSVTAEEIEGNESKEVIISACNRIGDKRGNYILTVEPSSIKSIGIILGTDGDSYNGTSDTQRIIKYRGNSNITLSIPYEFNTGIAGVEPTIKTLNISSNNESSNVISSLSYNQSNKTISVVIKNPGKAKIIIKSDGAINPDEPLETIYLEVKQQIYSITTSIDVDIYGENANNGFNIINPSTAFNKNYTINYLNNSNTVITATRNENNANLDIVPIKVGEAQIQVTFEENATIPSLSGPQTIDINVKKYIEIKVGTGFNYANASNPRGYTVPVNGLNTENLTISVGEPMTLYAQIHYTQHNIFIDSNDNQLDAYIDTNDITVNVRLITGNCDGIFEITINAINKNDNTNQLTLTSGDAKVTLNFEITGGDEYFWYAGQTQPSSMNSNPEVDDENFTNNTWHTLGTVLPNTINQKVTGGTAGNEWFVVTPKDQYVPTASDLSTVDGSQRVIDIITIGTEEYDVWNTGIETKSCGVWMKKQ